MIHLYRATAIEDFDNYFKLKADPSAILWSGFTTSPDKERLRQHFERVRQNEDIFVYYLLDDSSGDIIGYGQLDREGKDEAHYSGTSILTKYQGKGYSKHLTKLLMEKAKEHGFSRVFAWISEHNIPSIKSYESNGFVKTEKNKMVRLEALNRDDKFYLYEKFL